MLLNITELVLLGEKVLLSLVFFTQRTLSYVIHKLYYCPAERTNTVFIWFQIHPDDDMIAEVLNYLCDFNYLPFICLESKVISIKTNKAESSIKVAVSYCNCFRQCNLLLHSHRWGRFTHCLKFICAERKSKTQKQSCFLYKLSFSFSPLLSCPASPTSPAAKKSNQLLLKARDEMGLYCKVKKVR